MERKLLVAFASLSLVLTLVLAVTLSLMAGLPWVPTALAQGLGAVGQGGCLRGGQSLSQIPCLTRAAAGRTVSGATATGIPLSGNVVKDAEAAGLAYYRQRYGNEQVTVKATDYGCHIQVDVFKDGKVVKSLGYDGAGGIYEF
jgi:hypothetical protein